MRNTLTHSLTLTDRCQLGIGCMSSSANGETALAGPASVAVAVRDAGARRSGVLRNGSLTEAFSGPRDAKIPPPPSERGRSSLRANQRLLGTGQESTKKFKYTYPNHRDQRCPRSAASRAGRIRSCGGSLSERGCAGASVPFAPWPGPHSHCYRPPVYSPRAPLKCPSNGATFDRVTPPYAYR